MGKYDFVECCEAVIMGKALVAHIPTKKILADLLTKVLYGQRCRFLVDRMLWDVFPAIRCHRSPQARVQLMTDPFLWVVVALSYQSAGFHLVFPVTIAKAIRPRGSGTLWGTDKMQRNGGSILRLIIKDRTNL